MVEIQAEEAKKALQIQQQQHMKQQQVRQQQQQQVIAMSYFLVGVMFWLVFLCIYLIWSGREGGRDQVKKVKCEAVGSG